jgi:DNA mismatch endonuclease, patch repair protein
MSRIRGKDTAPELSVRRRLHRLGYRYILHSSRLPGRPDLAFPARRKAIFVHGCFWHGHNCRHGLRRPSSNVEFWSEKYRANKRRDLGKQRSLKKLGWDVCVVWECEVRTDVWLDRVVRFLETRSP